MRALDHRLTNAPLRIVSSGLLVLTVLFLPLDVAGADGAPMIVAAGDISNCATSADEATANLVEQLAGTVASLGDSRYGKAKCYDDTWGPLRERIRPAMGNHDLEQGSWYYTYFGAEAGPAGKGYYSYDVGAWHVVVLNSNCRQVGCGPDSTQTRWLVDDLAGHPGHCTLAYWHHPRWSSDRAYGNDQRHRSLLGRPVPGRRRRRPQRSCPRVRAVRTADPESRAGRSGGDPPVHRRDGRGESLPLQRSPTQQRGPGEQHLRGAPAHPQRQRVTTGVSSPNQAGTSPTPERPPATSRPCCRLCPSGRGAAGGLLDLKRRSAQWSSWCCRSTSSCQSARRL